MKPLIERLNDRLEQQGICSWSGQESADQPVSPVPACIHDPEVDALAALARHLQSAPPLQVDPAFARRVEGRILARNAALYRKQSAPSWWSWLFPRPQRMRPMVRATLCLWLLVLLLGTGVLVAAAQSSNPANPLSGIKSWEQHAQLLLANSPTDRAELDIQIAHDRLHPLADLTDLAHAKAYSQALVDLDQQINAATQAINALPAGPNHARLASELALLEANARHTLRGLLHQLALPGRLVTTDELGRLGDAVPRFSRVEVTLSAQPHGQATISITGDDLQPGAQLLVDGQLSQARGSIQDGVSTFVANWVGTRRPQSVGILNPDGTASQTTAMTLKILDDATKGKGSQNGNGKGKGGGNGKRKGVRKSGGIPAPNKDARNKRAF